MEAVERSMKPNRRQFLNETFSTCASFGAAAALLSMHERLAFGDSPETSPLRLCNDENTGLPLLRLPEGFRYRTFSWTGDPMSGDVPTPPEHDAMGVIQAEGDIVTLVRNQEISKDGHALESPTAKPYDKNACGGCVTLKFNTSTGEWLDSWVSLSGSSRNCAGGVTPWGTWLSCEETVLGSDLNYDRYKLKPRNFEETHGWIFEVDPQGVGSPEPLKDMGRFVHEAVAIDHESGIVYETEDRETAGFYRFLPNEKGNLKAGGTLQIAEVVGQPDLRGGVPANSRFDVRWHTIPDPQLAHTPGTNPPDELGVYTQGKQLGGSTFSRLEGCWFGNGLVYFDATSGGSAAAGQIWQYDPQAEQLALLFESPDKRVLNMPDNLCVSPQGGLVLCEDNDYGADEYPQRIFVLSKEGKLSLFAQNNVVLQGEKNGFKGDFRNKEWAGACFSPDGQWLFVNAQTPGITFAITGPWEQTLLA
jgi:secreted PhoX family phosphatase